MHPHAYFSRHVTRSARMERMATLEPLFVDVTWGAGGSTSDLTLAISANAQKYLGVEVLMHLTCTNLKVRLARPPYVTEDTTPPGPIFDARLLDRTDTAVWRFRKKRCGNRLVVSSRKLSEKRLV